MTSIYTLKDQGEEVYTYRRCEYGYPSRKRSKTQVDALKSIKTLEHISNLSTR